MEKLAQETVRDFCRRIILSWIDQIHYRRFFRSKGLETKINEYARAVNEIVRHYSEIDMYQVKLAIRSLAQDLKGVGINEVDTNRLLPMLKT